MLICRPVSARSDSAKIRRWIDEMEARRERYRDDPGALELIELCVRQARSWLEPAARPDGPPAEAAAARPEPPQLPLEGLGA